MYFGLVWFGLVNYAWPRCFCACSTETSKAQESTPDIHNIEVINLAGRQAFQALKDRNRTNMGIKEVMEQIE